MKLSYQQAYDRIVSAYFRDEIRRMDGCACFIGNLLGDHCWIYALNNVFGDDGGMERGRGLISEYGYTAKQIDVMEKNFMDLSRPGKEDDLFTAMSSTLDMLKEIHRTNGEIIDNEPIFTKRQIEYAK